MINQLIAGGIASLLWAPASLFGAGAAAASAITKGVTIPEGIVVFTGFMALLFSFQYLDGKERRKFVATMSFFLVAMLMFLRAQDWLYMYTSWELMSLISYVLIALKSTEAARKAARKAFIIGRVSGLAFLAAFVMTYLATGTIEFTTIPSAAAVMLLIAAMAKASQFPFVWLPDAMEAPTPVSALLHSATMVAAGPLLLYMFAPYFAFLNPYIKAWALLSLVIASFTAMAQNHAKRLLAYSSIATLAFLFMIFDSPALPLAFATHALLKAAFFMLVGTYARGFNYSTEIGLDVRSLSSHLTLFLIVSLAGVPPFGLFWNKVGEGPLALVTLFLALIYFLRMHSSMFSGGIQPPRNLGTFAALALAIISIPSSLELAIPNLQRVIEFLVVSFVAFRVHKLRVWETIGNIFTNAFRFEMPDFVGSEELIEGWGFSGGKIITRVSDRFRSILTGPVTRDVVYIAVSLAALALGVMMC